MGWQQLQAPNLSVQDFAGWCLRFNQSVNSAPVMHNTAIEAANATEYKHTEPDFPPVSVPVWFDDGNMGHVVQFVPGQGFLSSPFRGYGQQWLGSLAEVEAGYRCRFIFWSEDINTLRVAEWVDDPIPPNRYNKGMVLVASAGNFWVLGYGSCTRIGLPAIPVARRMYGTEVNITKPENFVFALRSAGVPENVPAKILETQNVNAWSFQRGFFNTRDVI